MRTIYQITKIVNNRMQVVARATTIEAAIEKMIELSNEAGKSHFVYGGKMNRAIYFAHRDNSSAAYYAQK